jgi:hypothetical protein
MVELELSGDRLGSAAADNLVLQNALQALRFSRAEEA